MIEKVLTTLGGLNYRQLNFVSLSSVSAATVVAFALPPIEETVYFHRSGLEGAEEQPLQSGGEGGSKRRVASLTQSLLRIRQDFKDSFGNPYVVKWSLWWALGMCGNFQVHTRGCMNKSTLGEKLS